MPSLCNDLSIVAISTMFVSLPQIVAGNGRDDTPSHHPVLGVVI